MAESSFPRIFSIADLHLSFSREKPMGIFGTAWENHSETIERNWRSLVDERDIVLIPGDISWAMQTEEAAPDLKWIEGLPGRKILLKGNHDYWWSSISRLRESYPELFFLQHDSVLVDQAGNIHAGFTENTKSAPGMEAPPYLAVCGTRGWLLPSDPSFKVSEDKKIYEREVIRMRLALTAAKNTGAEKILVCTHYPPATQGVKSELLTLFEEYGVRTVVYGHLHGKDAWKKGVKDLQNGVNYHLTSADYINFAPVLIKV
jgi:predicted phosphohydrolase